MAIKYTEEQLNTVDKSLIIQMFLNQQEELSKAVNPTMPASDVLPKRWIILTRFHLWK